MMLCHAQNTGAVAAVKFASKMDAMSKSCRKLTILKSCILERVETNDTNRFSRAYSAYFKSKRQHKIPEIQCKADINSTPNTVQRQISTQHLRRGSIGLGSGILGTVHSFSIDGIGRFLNWNRDICDRCSSGDRRVYRRQRIVQNAQPRIQSRAGRGRLCDGHQYAQLRVLGARFHVIRILARLGDGTERVCGPQFDPVGRKLYSTGPAIACATPSAACYLHQLSSLCGPSRGDTISIGAHT